MKRTKLADRLLPTYSHAEELFHMISHIVGGGLGVVALVLCVVFSAIYQDAYAIVASSIYGISLISLYCMSSIYHGLHEGMAKRVMQVMDHCTIYFLIAGTYTPVLLISMRQISPTTAWILFGVVWGLTALAVTLTAIDLKKYSAFSMICYIGMGWSIVFAADVAIKALGTTGIIYMLAGGIAYTIGAILYGLGKKRRYMHAIFHLFVLIGSILQFISILFYNIIV